MRITICCKRFGPSGGAELFLGNFARCLLAEGHRVRVIAAEFTGPLEGVETVRLSLPPVPRSLRDLSLARASRRALAEDDADVTFSDQKCWGADVVRPGGGVQREYFKQWRKSFRSPLWRLAHDVRHALSIRDRLRLHIDDVLYAPPGPRLIIANSDMVRRNLLRHYPHLRDRVAVVYNGADAERFSPALREQHRDAVRAELDIPADALVGIFVGTGWQRKGLYTFVEALGILGTTLTDRPVYGIVVGRGPQRLALRYARRCGAGERVRFAGPALPDRYYGAADLLVLPSYFDPCANVTLEALACGLPVVTSAHNGASELLTPGQNGFVVEDASDAAGVAQCIERFMDEHTLAEASRAARARALEHTVERQYREIIGAMAPLVAG